MAIHDDELQIVYESGRPTGIRDRGGYLFFFLKVQKWPGQEERYLDETKQQDELAEFLLNALLNS